MKLGLGTDGRFSMSIETAAMVLLSLFVAVFALDVLGFSLPLVRPVFAFCLLTFVPGALVLTLCGLGPRAELRWGLYAVGVSMLTILAVVLFINLVYPVFGVARPLSPVPLAATFGLLVCALAAAVRRTDPPRRGLAVPSTVELTPIPLALLSLPLLSILAVKYLNVTDINVPILLVLGTISVMPLAVAVGAIRARWHALCIWALAIALLYHKSLWWFYEFTGQGNIVTAWKFGRWTLGTNSQTAAVTPLLPNVALSPTYAHLGGLDIFTQLSVVNPLLVSLMPVGMFVMVRRPVGSRDAFLGACVFAFAHPFYHQLPAGGRAATPVFFLTFLGLVLTDSRLAPLGRRSLGLGFTAGFVVSHYGAAYLLLLALTVAVALLALSERLDALEIPVGRPIASDGGHDSAADATPDEATARLQTDEATAHSRLLSPAYVGLYAAMTLGWYMYVFGGRKLDVLFEQLVTALVDLYSGPSGGGTASRLAKDYGTSVQFSKYIYVVLAGLMAVGLLAAYHRRYLTDSEDGFSDEFLGLSAALLFGFGLTLVVAGSWGGGRPMALAFCITGVFVPVGIRALGAVGARLVAVVRRRLGHDGGSGVASLIGRSTIAVLLAGMVLLNTGVVAAVAVGGTAPSNVPLQHTFVTSDDPTLRSETYRESDIDMYVWLVEHHDPSLTVYGDWITISQYNDWYNPQISADADPSRPYNSIKHKNTLVRLADADDPGYAMLGGHNTALGTIALKTGTVPLATVEPELSARDKIYTTGYGAIYVSED